MGTAGGRRGELLAIIKRIEAAYPRASVSYAHLVAVLIAAPDRTMAVADLSDAMGKGRDSSAIQRAVKQLAAIELVRVDETTEYDGQGRSSHRVTLAGA